MKHFSNIVVPNENFEELVYDLQDVGQFNQKDKEKVDRSREETRSSWSSSEEALQACEGLIFNIPLNGGTKCHVNATSLELKQSRTTVELEVEKTGFYYFIFANENEMTDNFLSGEWVVVFTLPKLCISFPAICCPSAIR